MLHMLTLWLEAKTHPGVYDVLRLSKWGSGKLGRLDGATTLLLCLVSS